LTGNRNSFGGKPVRGIAKKTVMTVYMAGVCQVHCFLTESGKSPAWLRRSVSFIKNIQKSENKKHSEYYKKIKIMFDKIENI